MNQLKEILLNNPRQEADVLARTFDCPEDGVRYFILRELNEDGTMAAGLALSRANCEHLYHLLGEVLSK